MAADQARLEVVAALVPVCVEQSRQDSNVTATLASLKGEAATYKRGEMLMMGHHAGLNRSRQERGEGLHGQAGRAVLARPKPMECVAPSSLIAPAALQRRSNRDGGVIYDSLEAFDTAWGRPE